MKAKVNVICFNVLKVTSSAGMDTLKSNCSTAQSVITDIFNQVPSSECFSSNFIESTKRIFSHEFTVRLNGATTELQIVCPPQAAPLLEFRVLSKTYRCASKI